MAKPVLINNARLCAASGVHAQGWLLTRGSVIEDLGWDREPPEVEAEGIDAGGALLAPGMIDLHVHGALGYDTMDATPEALQTLARFTAQHGVTAFLATTMTETAEAIVAALDNVAHVMAAGTGGAELLGAHVEGPYLDVARRGCQDPDLIRCADRDEYERFLATGVVRLLTLAPEYPENHALIRRAREAGIAVAAGHTRASYEQMRYAVDLGVSQVTHLFNGMEPMHHRRPGAVGAALTLEGLRCQLIADNIHVHPAMLALALRCKGANGIILVTDAMGGAGMPDGEYHLGGLSVTVQEGVARVADGSLAGSTLTLERGVLNMAAAAGLGLPEALIMATRTPAHALGLAHRKGSLALGMDADLILLDEDANVRLTMIAGEIVYQG
jgi:N-acetylglucosamine-6-phosphate deacetylase